MIIVRFEALADHRSRIMELRRIVEFLDIPGVSDRTAKISNEQLRCAFLLAESPDVSCFSSTYSSCLWSLVIYYYSQTHRPKQRSRSKNMSKNDAYTNDLVCQLWRHIGRFARRENYTIWKDIECAKTDNSSPEFVSLV